MNEYERLNDYIQYIIQVNGMDYVASNYLSLREQFYQTRNTS